MKGREGPTASRCGRHPALLLILLILAVFLPARDIAAQEPGPAAAAPLQLQEEVSPRGAFLRALLVPGWGHAAIGEHTRGGFYFLAETSSVWMMVRTRSRLRAARAVRDLQMAEVAARQAALGVTDPRAIATAQNADPRVRAARELVESRGQQFQDWLALGVFLAFLSGADAFVSAHLKDFPDPVGIELRPVGSGVDLLFTVPVGRGGAVR